MKLLFAIVIFLIGNIVISYYMTYRERIVNDSWDIAVKIFGDASKKYPKPPVYVDDNNLNNEMLGVYSRTTIGLFRLQLEARNVKIAKSILSNKKLLQYVLIHEFGHAILFMDGISREWHHPILFNTMRCLLPREYVNAYSDIELYESLGTVLAYEECSANFKEKLPKLDIKQYIEKYRRGAYNE